MANVERANREFDQVANFGLGLDNQAEDLFGSTDEVEGSLGINYDAVPTESYTDEFGALGNTAGPKSSWYDGYNLKSGFAVKQEADTFADYTGTLDPSEEITIHSAIRGYIVNTRETSLGGNSPTETIAVWGEAVADNAAAADGAYVNGGYFLAVSNGAGQSTPRGVSAQAVAYGIGGDGNINNMIGLNGLIQFQNSYSGTVGEARAINASTTIGNGGTMTSSYGVYIDAAQGSGAAANVANVRGLFVEDHSAAGATSSYNIESQGATAKNLFAGRVIYGVPNSAIADADLANGQASFYLNEAGNVLTVKLKYGAGTVKTGTIALT